MKIIIALVLGATGSAALPIPKTIARTHSAAAAAGGPKKAFALDQIVVPLKQDDALPAIIAVGEIRTKLPGFLAESKHDIIKRRLEQTNEYKLIKSGFECNSGDAWLGKFGTVQGCADKCAQTEGCRFFISGIVGSQGDKTGSCYHEKTSKKECPEGWESDSYNFYESIAATTKATTTTAATEAESKSATAAERALCLEYGGSCDECCEGITGKCQEITVSGSSPAKRALYKIPGLTEQDDCLLLEGDFNYVDATSPRLKRPWLFFASARRVGKRRRRCDRRVGQRQPPLRQRLPRPSGIPVRRRLVRARAARRSRRRFARA